MFCLLPLAFVHVRELCVYERGKALHGHMLEQLTVVRLNASKTCIVAGCPC
jgi:hypothetical protein